MFWFLFRESRILIRCDSELIDRPEALVSGFFENCFFLDTRLDYSPRGCLVIFLLSGFDCLFFFFQGI